MECKHCLNYETILHNIAVQLGLEHSSDLAEAILQNHIVDLALKAKKKTMANLALINQAETLTAYQTWCNIHDLDANKGKTLNAYNKQVLVKPIQKLEPTSDHCRRLLPCGSVRANLSACEITTCNNHPEHPNWTRRPVRPAVMTSGAGPKPVSMSIRQHDFPDQDKGLPEHKH